MGRIAGGCLAVLLACWGSAVMAQTPQMLSGRTEFGVFCVDGRLVLAQKRLEEMKQVHRGSVCRVDQDQSDTAAREKLLRRGGASAPCSCDL